MQTLSLRDIVIPSNRQRRDFDPLAIADLATSIRTHGLLHAITVRNDGHTLVAGERRLKAIATLTANYNYGEVEIPLGQVPIVRLCELDPLTLREVELEENTIRLDLTWQERDAAVAELHALRTAQAAERGETHTKARTVQELMGRPASTGEAAALVSNAILVSSHLDDPDVAKAKTRKEALNIIKKKLTETHNATLAAKLQEQGIASRHSLIRGDCRLELAKLPDATFDIICTDPPYGIDADTFNPLSGSEAHTVHEYTDDLEYAVSIWMSIFKEGSRVCKPKAHLYMFFDIRHWEGLRNLAEQAGWWVWPRPIIWHKPAGGMLGDITRGPRRSYETILFASRGDRLVTKMSLDVIVANPRAELHAAEKPVEVITNLLQRSCMPGDRVLDPCAGSGTIFEAATALTLTAIGIEMVEKHYNTALVRLNRGDSDERKPVAEKA